VGKEEKRKRRKGRKKKGRKMNEWGEKSRKNLNLWEVFQDEWNNLHPCV